MCDALAILTQLSPRADAHEPACVPLTNQSSAVTFCASDVRPVPVREPTYESRFAAPGHLLD